MTTMLAPVRPQPALLAPSHRRAVERVIEAVSERLDERYSLRDLAGVALLSPYHFHRVFRHATGIPPGRFLAALRIEAAKRMLVMSEERVTDVCLAVGYHSLGTFTSQFSRHVGLSPRQLRKLSRGNLALPAVPCERRPGGATTVSGRLHFDDDFEGLAFVGLFPTPLPEGRPAGCALAEAPGEFRVTARGEGRYYVLAGALPPSPDPVSFLLPGGELRVARLGPIHVRRGRPIEDLELTLAPKRLIDPPILVAPLLLVADAAYDSASSVPQLASSG